MKQHLSKMLKPEMIGLSSPQSDLENLQAYERVSTKYSDIDTMVYQSTLETKLRVFGDLLQVHRIAGLDQVRKSCDQLDGTKFDSKLAQIDRTFIKNI